MVPYDELQRRAVEVTLSLASCDCLKATAPLFWKICGDLGGINKFVVIPQDVIFMNKELEKARVSSSLADLDLANALHELKLAVYTNQCLAVPSSWRLHEPCFLSEGVDSCDWYPP